jgi:CBS domain-containing protein
MSSPADGRDVAPSDRERRTVRASQAIRRSGIAVRLDQTVGEAAVLMDRSGVGSLAVLDDGRLVGIVTDRDLVRRALARDLPAESRVERCMSTPVITIDAEADVHDAFALFRRTGCRRLPVVRDGAFVGMLTVDDLLINLASDLADIARPVTAEVIFGHHDSPPAPPG